MREVADFLICPLPLLCFLSPECQTIAFKFAAKLIIHHLQNHQQVREMELVNSFVILEFLVVAVMWLLLDASPKLVFFLCPFIIFDIMSSSLNTLPCSEMTEP